jgi:FAD/FMN-containing dehydrogenase
MTPALIAQFAVIVGEKYAINDPAAMASHLHEPRDLYHGLSPLVLKPGSTAEVSAILKLANETRTTIVPQGGNTGLVGGQTADTTGTEVILSLSRLNRIREFDLDGNCVVVEAGVVLETLVRAVEDQGRLFPLWLGSAGSCQIGGNLASNAGGTQVLAYGNMRELCLGLEVVLPDGQVLNSLSRLKKDNTGYDLRDLFIGSEGTLGRHYSCGVETLPAAEGQGGGLGSGGKPRSVAHSARPSAGSGKSYRV